jgi:TonB family protein
VAASIVTHALLVAVIGALAYRSLAAREAALAIPAVPAPSATIAIELPLVSDGTLLEDVADVPEGAPPDAHGGATVARMDTGQAGHGGERTTAERATNLADDDDALKLGTDLVSHLTRDQHQRMRTARVRATREDRRATTNPTELTFLATGKGEREERRPVAGRDPSRGSLVAPKASALGGAPGARSDSEADDTVVLAGSSALGRTRSSPGIGVRDGVPGDDHHAGARITYARPSVAEGAVAVPAVARARPNDTVDSDQEVATTVRSLVHASVAGGIAAASGRGGTDGPEVLPGAGAASGRGSVARPLGAGDGDVFDWFTSDPALLPYFRKLHAKVDPLWRDAFPKSAMLELKQGTVILELVIAADGSAKVSWPPLRPSGIDEFDRNCADAVRRASPFEPIPRSLGRGSLRIRAPFVAKNPIVK